MSHNSRSGGLRSRSPCWQQPNCVRHASNPNVLQELLYCFQGADGNIIRFDKETGFTIRNDVCFEQSHMIYQLLELGFLFHSVKKLLESQQKCMVSKGLATVIQAKLNSYYMHIAALHTKTQERSAENRVDLVTLTHVLPWAREKMLLLQFMITILEQTKNMVGGAVLNPILKHLPHGNQKLHDAFKELLLSAGVPLYQMIWYWIIMGTIKDPYNEFFVKENIEYSRTKAWQCQFSLRKEYVPSCLDGLCSKLILDVGKCMHFVDKFYPEKAFQVAASKKGQFDIESCDLNSFVDECGLPVLKLKRMYSESSELVLEVMKSKYKLNDFFTQLHEYIFLTQGHFASYFMELMHPFFYKTVSEVTPSHLKKILHRAMKACSQRPRELSNFDNIEIYYNEFTEDDVIADIFTLHYRMEGPIKIMFQIFELSYRKLFMFLWKKNHVLYTMKNTWKLLRSLFKTKNLPSEIHEGFKQLFTMNFQLMQFMYQLDFYIVYEVIGKNVSEFFEKLEMTRAIDEVVDAHAKMLRFILLGTLLDPEHTDLRAQLTNIFSLVTEIEDLTMSLFVYMGELDDGTVTEDVKNLLNAKVEILTNNNEVALRNLISFLKSCKHTDGLNFFCDRINFNEFY